LSIGILLALVGSACWYPKQRLQELTQQAKRRIEESLPPGEKCSRQGGVMYNEQCYIANEDSTTFNQEECRLRAGLYIDDQCLFPPHKGVVVERPPMEEEKE
jgi:hypothetical protein